MRAKPTLVVAAAGLLGTALAASRLRGSTLDAIELAAAAGAAALGAGLLGAILLHAARHQSIAFQNVLVALTPVAAVATGAMASAHLMMVSSQPIAALGVVLTSAGTVGILISLMLGARLRAGSEQLISATRKIGEGDLSTIVERPAAQELARLAAELESMQLRLEKSRARERALEEARRQLVDWISHDLRTPLARIRAIVEALQDEVLADPAEVSMYYERLRAEADRLGALVNDLFELNRINAGELHLERERVNLSDVVSDVVASFGLLATARGVQLTAQQPPTDVEVDVSPTHLERALGNLIDNALRYTEAGGVVNVGLSVDPHGASVTVDDGCGGLELTKLERLLAHSNVPGDLVDTGATGLGLAIAKGLVEVNGGKIAVHGTTRGCRFAIALPHPPSR